jgi:hypothetical protein
VVFLQQTSPLSIPLSCPPSFSQPLPPCLPPPSSPSLCPSPQGSSPLARRKDGKTSEMSCRGVASRAAAHRVTGTATSHLRRRWKWTWKLRLKSSTQRNWWASTISRWTVAVERVRGQGICDFISTMLLRLPRLLLELLRLFLRGIFSDVPRNKHVECVRRQGICGAITIFIVTMWDSQ